MRTTAWMREGAIAPEENAIATVIPQRPSARLAEVAPPVETVREEIEALVRRVCLRIPPSFPLDDLVAVNPFVGFTELPFFRTHAAFERLVHADLLPPLPAFRRMFDAGRFDANDVREAVAEWNETDAAHYRAPRLDAVLTVQLLDGTLGVDAFSTPSAGPRVLSIAGRLDAAHGLGLEEAIVHEIATLASGYFDRGLAKLRAPSDRKNLFDAFRAFAVRDLSMRARGVDGLRELARSLPYDPYEAIDALLPEIPLAGISAEAYLGRLLWEVQGWAGALRSMAFRSAHDGLGELPDLLAIRLTYDALLRNSRALAKFGPLEPSQDGEVRDEVRYDVALRFVLLRAAERGVRRKLVREFQPGPARAGDADRPDVQAVFCIDVRSEPLRRMFETASNAVETYGFAGFFGIPVAVTMPEAPEGRLQCPVLLSPGHRVGLRRDDPETTSRGQAAALLGDVRRGAFGAFEYVETFGFASLFPLLREALFGSATDLCAGEHAPIDLSTLSRETKAALAVGMLKNLGLKRPFARVLLLCAHDARSANNPQAAALSCGACAGHGGSVNARIGAALLNDPEVREDLAEHGFELPYDFVAIAAVHETTIDDIRILDAETIPKSHEGDLARLERLLVKATDAVREQRARELPGLDAKNSPRALLRALWRRTRNWSEVRPEWALANNVAFVAARRERTRGVNLQGRAFLHSYDRTLDPDGSVLELILTAPVVVASWINLQYYASTVAPEKLGSGTKTIHNVSGGIGVVQGNGGDLAVGLSHQSVHDGTNARHEPLRLQVFVEDLPERIDAVLAKHAGLADLVRNEYIVLHALDPNSSRCERLLPGRGWIEAV